MTSRGPLSGMFKIGTMGKRSFRRQQREVKRALRKAKKTSKRRKAGDKYLINIPVNAKTYRALMTGDGLANELSSNKKCVFDSIREKMWWFHEDAHYKVVDGVRVKATSGGTKCPEPDLDFDESDSDEDEVVVLD